MDELDAYGRRRSIRSTPTGPGSRGGRWHEQDYRAEYWRTWRRTHSDYRDRETRRSQRRAAARREAIAKALPSFTETLVAMLRVEVATGRIAQNRLYGKQREIGRRLLISDVALGKILNDGRSPRGDTVDALITYFGFDHCVTNYRRMRQAARKEASMPETELSERGTRPPLQEGVRAV